MYKVGDIICNINPNNGRKAYKIIKKVLKEYYIYDLYHRDDDKMYTKNYKWSRTAINEQSRYYTKKVLRTKIAEKVFKNRILKETEEHLWISPE